MSDEFRDASLVRRARRGDPTAFEALVRSHFRAAYAVALAIVSSPMDAEDVCQDAFLRALERLDDCRRPERFVGWLLQIVRNRARNYRSYRQLRSTLPLEDITTAGTIDTTTRAERAELRRILEEALADLSETQREVVLLHDLEGWKHREIAEMLGVSEVMSRQHLFSARRTLRERIGVQVFEEHSND